MNITNDKNERINVYFKKINESKEGIKNENFEKKILYEKNGNKEFEGQIKNNKIEGKGIKYNKKGIKIYEGYYKNGKPEGKGISYYENGNKEYEGYYKNGKPEGKGIQYYENGNKYYEGDYKNGKPEGKGIEYYKNGNKIYEGDYKNGKSEGKGIKYYENGNKIYEGDYKNDKVEGKGIQYYENGNKEYEGDYKNGEAEGKGIQYYENGNKLYEGDYKNCCWEGKGIEYYENGNKKYEGYFKNGEFEEKGIVYYENEKIEFIKDFKIHGKEIKFKKNGKIEYVTILKNDKFEKIKENINFTFNKYDDNNFIEIDYITKGAYGIIYRAYSIKDKKEVCLKKINIDNMKIDYDNDYLEYIDREINILKSLSKYKSSVHYYGDYDSNNEKILIIEKCDKNLRDYIEKDKKIFNIEDIKNKFKGLNEVFKAMQKESIIHRDLKLENILVKYINKEKNEIILKLTDYGISKIKNKKISGLRGTLDYIAPEILLNKVEEYKSSFDIFSLGIILYQISHQLS